MTAWLRRIMETVANDTTQEIVQRRSLVLAPHPDDEVLGCGGTIARKAQQGTLASIVFLTDGRHGAQGPPEEVTALREAEAWQAAEALGLLPERLVFLRIEDGHLNAHLEQAAHHVRRLVASLDVSDLFVPYRREFHPDHLAAWRIGAASLPHHGRLYEYPIWFGPWLWERLGWKARVAAATHLMDAIHAVKFNITAVADLKRRALAAYRSQMAAFERQQPWGPTFLTNFLGDYEMFFVHR